MSTNQPLAVDFVQEESLLQILPNLPLLTSYQSNWQHIHLAHHRQSPWELPEVSSDQHIIYIPTNYQPASMEVTSEGRLQTVGFHPDEVAKGLFGILPAKFPYKVAWNVNIEFIHCYLEPQFLANIAHESVNPDRVELLFEARKNDLLIQQIGLALKADLEADGIGNCFYADSLATAMAAHVVRHYSTRKHNFRSHEDGLSPQKLTQAIEYINEHLGENLSLTAIAQEVEMSHYYFCRLFKKSTGMTAHQYLIQQRVERAKQLLKQSERTVTDIALECGFTHPSHLAKCFHRHTGLTPTQFRQL